MKTPAQLAQFERIRNGPEWREAIKRLAASGHHRRLGAKNFATVKNLPSLGGLALVKSLGPEGLKKFGSIGGTALANSIGSDGMYLRSIWARHLQWHITGRKRTSRHVPKPCVFCRLGKTYEEITNGQ